MDLYLDGKRLEKAVTSAGPAEIRMTQGTEKTTISAGQFETRFNADNRLNALLGSPDAKIVTSTPGRPDRITTSRELTAAFNAKGEIISAEQTGDFHYQEGTQTASSDRAKYIAADDSIALTGSPRLVDSRGILTADTIHLNRKTGGAFAQGNVKSTYSGLKAQPGGAMLASAEPIHVTGTTVTASKSTEVAKYTNARLWQGANIVEAPEISFDRAHRSLQAQGGLPGQVNSVFVQPDKKGKITPVNVTADKLSYVDSDRKAVFSGNVLVRSEETTIAADTLDVFLLARGSRSDAQAGSQLDRIEGKGDIKIQQPNRRATGSQLVYTSAEHKIVLTGTENKRPSMFDAERGQITGDSLTFFTHDGRVLVGSGESSSDSHPKDSRRE
jgi:lipopolysaccharide export system protein LptA